MDIFLNLFNLFTGVLVELMIDNQDEEKNQCLGCIFSDDCESAKAGQCILEDLRIKDKVTKRYNKKKDKKMKNKKYDEYGD